MEWFVFSAVIALVGVGMAFTGASTQERRSTAARLTSIQRKLDLVMEHLGIADTGPEQAEVVRHLEAGKPIHALRAYRRHTGASLLEAKQAVDRIAAERGLADQ
jgi:ribosomal protein L7/L12